MKIRYQLTQFKPRNNFILRGINTPDGMSERNAQWLNNAIQNAWNATPDGGKMSYDVSNKGDDTQQGKNVGEEAANIASSKGPYLTGYSLACYPALHSWYKQAYTNVEGSAPSVFNEQTKSIPNNVRGNILNRTYPKTTKDFTKIFGSIAGATYSDPNNEQYRGKGVAGAMVMAGLGSYVSNISNGLKAGAAIQFWKTNDDYQNALAGKEASGHSVIFVGYVNDGKTLICADQWGVGKYDTTTNIYTSSLIRGDTFQNHWMSLKVSIGANVSNSK